MTTYYSVNDVFPYQHLRSGTGRAQVLNRCATSYTTYPETIVTESDVSYQAPQTFDEIALAQLIRTIFFLSVSDLHLCRLCLNTAYQWRRT